MAAADMAIGAALAVVLFLYGIENLSFEIQRIAGERFRGLLARAMSNKWAGALMSAVATSVLQSSTATTVIAVGLVNAGLITFSQSLSIIAGANIGTTITAQLVAFNMMGVAPLFIIAGFLLSVLGGRYGFVGKSLFYFGLVFFSLMLLSEAMAPLRGSPDIAGFLMLLRDPALALLAGVAITVLMQSSSVTTGIVVLMGMQGLLGLGEAIPVIMGANIGTTATALLAAYRLDVFAKRTAIAHMMFNVMGVAFFFPFIPQFAEFVAGFGGDAGRMIANAHLVFNIATAVAFLLVSDRVAVLVGRIVKSDRSEIVFAPKYLNGALPSRTGTAIRMVLRELENEAAHVRELFSLSLEMAKRSEVGELRRAEKLEALSDFLDERIYGALLLLSRRKLSRPEADKVSRLARISSEMEQLADLGEDLARIAKRMNEKQTKLMPSSLAELASVEAKFFANLETMEKSLVDFARGGLGRVRRNSRDIEASIAASYASHLKRMEMRNPSHYAGTSFTDVIAAIESADAKINSIMRHRQLM